MGNLGATVRSLGPRRALAAAMTLLLLATLGWACTGSETSQPSAGSGEVSGALELYQLSVQRSNSLDSWRSETDLSMVMLGQRVSARMETEVAKDGRARSAMGMDTPQGRVDVETVLGGSFVYTRVPIVGWVRLSGESLGSLTGQSLESLYTNFFQSLFPTEEIPWEIVTVESLGSEVLDGTPTEHLRIGMDFQQYVDSLDLEALEQVPQAIAAGVIAGEAADFERLLDGVAVQSLEVWVDGDGYTHRMYMDYSVPSQGDIQLDMRMFDHGQDIRIEVPTSFQEFP